MKCIYLNSIEGRCAAAILARFKKLTESSDFIGINYPCGISKILPSIDRNEEIFILDYTISEDDKEVIENALKNGCSITRIDHKLSSYSSFEGYDDKFKTIISNLDFKVSGAALTYMYLHNCNYEDIPTFIKYISDYTTWCHRYENKGQCLYLTLEMLENGPLSDIWKTLFDDAEKYDDMCLKEFVIKGELLRSHLDVDFASYIKKYSYETEVDGHKCLCINRKANSDIFGETGKEYPMTMVWVFDGERYSYTIFSHNEDVDCNAIAVKYGGGGTKNVAGFRSSELLFKKKQ